MEVPAEWVEGSQSPGHVGPDLHPLAFDPETLSLVSFRSKAAPEQEFIAAAARLPAFAIGYLDARHQYRLLTSQQAADVQVSVETNDDQRQLRAVYSSSAAMTCV